MLVTLQVVMATILFFPIIALILVYIICKKMKMDRHRAFGYAADLTTIILFVSVPLMIYSIWDRLVFLPLILIAVVIAMIFTYVDWRMKKEIEVIPLLKKLWRVYFILLGALYFVVWIGGLVYSIIDYVGTL